ncbi:MAG: hypothetical protein IJG13_15275, partial [Kiritimatiellae bacterium]|nr:hypothetical protein [Kiritimatiellia bacterium]
MDSRGLGVIAALAISFFATVGQAFDCGKLVVAERGKAAEYSIVVPEKASPSQTYAAEELRDFMEKATGVRLPIVTDAQPMPAKAIVLGGRHTSSDRLRGSLRSGDTSPAAVSAREDTRPPDSDGFCLKVDGSRLYIVGSAARGALYGAYEFLERFVGCRWYASWRTVVPRLDRVEIPCDLDETQTPAFAMREPFWYDVIQHPEFAARLRVNSRSWRRLGDKFGGDPYRFGGGLGSCHTFDRLLPPEKYFDEHPEYFSMVKGRR